MATNSFAPKKHEDFEIRDEDNKVVGHIRVKTSGVLWSSKGEHYWCGLTLEQLANLAKEHGKQQKK
jgi:hypothetical protein